MENEFDTIESTNDTEETVNQDEQNTEETFEDEPVEDEKDKTIKSLEAQKEHWRKKAQEAAQKPETKTVKSSNDLSQKDLFAMMNAKVSTEDFDEVVEFAKFKKIPVAEALNSSTLKAILNEKAEQRRTAQATSTGSTRRSSTKLSDEAILENASRGNLPESDEEIRRLVQLRHK